MMNRTEDRGKGVVHPAGDAQLVALLEERTRLPASPLVATLRQDIYKAAKASAIVSMEAQQRFLGLRDGEWNKLVVLDAALERGSGTVVTYVDNVKDLMAAANQADDFTVQNAPHGSGLYLVVNALRDGAELRADACGHWAMEQKGQGTSDNDIARRRAFYFDVDPNRPSGISATNEELFAALNRAEQIYEMVATLFRDTWALGFGVSGNGAQVHVALEGVPADEHTNRLINSILASADAFFSSVDTVKVDLTVSGAARLGPLFGSHKRKGIPSLQRPHRRSCFAGPAMLKRINLRELEYLAEKLFMQLPLEKRDKLAKSKVPPHLAAKATSLVTKGVQTQARRHDENAQSPFTIANSIDPHKVAERLELMAGEHPICPVCKRTGDSSVALVGRGIKCLHASCVEHGRDGFFTPVDMVVAVNGCSPIDAVRWIDGEFALGIDVRSVSANTSLVAMEKTTAAPAPVSMTATPATVSATAPVAMLGVWEAPIPLQPLTTLPVFPVSALPKTLADYVDALAYATQTPPDLGGMLVLATLSLSLARKFTAHLRAGWAEALALYVVVAMRSGERKSSVFGAVNQPVFAFEQRLARTFATKIAEAKAKQVELEVKLKEQTGASAWSEVAKTQEALDALVVPPTPRLIVDDITPEALGMLMAAQNQAMGVFAPEGGFFDLVTGRYSDGNANLDLVLKGHVGEDARVDRVKRGALIIHKATLVLGLAVQPHVIEQLGQKDGFRERGGAARLNIVFPTSLVGKRIVNAAPVPDAKANAFNAYITRLLELPPSLDDEGNIAPQPVRFDEYALAALLDYSAHLEPMLSPGGDLEPIADFAGKHPGTVARLAALLHLAEDPTSRSVNVHSVDRALVLGEYLLAHALHAFGIMAAPIETRRALRILAWIERKRVNTFSRRDAFEATKHARLLATAKDVEGALDVLVAHSYVRVLREEGSGRGRPKGPRYEVNPLAFIGTAG